MNKSTNPTQLRFPTMSGRTVRAGFDGGVMSSDFGALLLAGVDRQTGFTDRLSQAFQDKRKGSRTTHSIQDLLKQRIFQQASGYEDGNDANTLRVDPIFKMSLGKTPLDTETDLASQPTFSRLENSATSKDIYRMSRALVDQFIASYAKEPEVIVLDLDHTCDPTHGQQEFSEFNGHYGTHCYMPLTIFEGTSGKLVTAILRKGQRPTGKENATITKRVVQRIRDTWKGVHIILRGDGHFSNPELMDLALADEKMDFIFGLSSNSILKGLAEKPMLDAKAEHASRQQAADDEPVSSTRHFHEFSYAAGTWPKKFRVILKAEVSNLGTNPRFIVTSLEVPSPQIAYEELYCARGNDERYIKELKNELKCDRTSASSFLANSMRLIVSCAAYNLIHTLRSETLKGTALAKASASTIILKLFKIAVRVVQYKDRIKLHLPTSCAVKSILSQVTEIFYITPPPRLR